MKKWSYLLSIIGLILLVFFGTRAFYTQESRTVEEESQVLLEKVKTVTKLIAVEGEFAEIYDYKEYWKYDISPLRKKALVRVKARVSVGFDLNNMGIQAYPEERKLVISNIPDPKILSIEHDLDYYDITQGSFNAFTPEDYNKINKNAKAMIEKKAMESQLFEMAEQQGNELFEIIRFMVEGMGWQLEFQSSPGLKQ